jgi:hypothetical protein
MPAHPPLQMTGISCIAQHLHSYQSPLNSQCDEMHRVTGCWSCRCGMRRLSWSRQLCSASISSSRGKSSHLSPTLPKQRPMRIKSTPCYRTNGLGRTHPTPRSVPEPARDAPTRHPNRFAIVCGDLVNHVPIMYPDSDPEIRTRQVLDFKVRPAPHSRSSF